MPHPHIPLQRPLAVSLGIHVLIFGTALAFAHYPGALFRNEGTAITVSLVGGGGGAVTRRGPETALRMPVSKMTPASTVPAAGPAPAAEESTEANTGAAGPPSGGSDGTDPASAGKVSGDSSAVAGEAGGSAAGAFSLEQWRQLSSAIERAKTYPRLARERGIEGTVLVRFKVLPSGTVDAVNIVKSSGAEILDEASISTVYRAAPMPYVNGWIEVPMSYVLK